MVKQGWCKLVPNLLNTTDNDTREKVLHALNIMVIGCREEFKTSKIFTSLSNLQTEWQNIVNEVDNEEGDYFLQLYQLASDLKSKLN
jgi:nucleotide exchange factor SIL1